MPKLAALHTQRGLVRTRSIVQIDLDLPPDERWVEYASRSSTRKRLTDLAGQLEGMFGQNVNANVALAGLLNLGKKIVGGTINFLGRTCGVDHYAEIKSIADATGIPVSTLTLGNMIYDLVQAAGEDAVACSSYSAVMNGSPVLVRNMDWCWPPNTGEYTEVFAYHRSGELKYFNVGVCGMVGVLSAFMPGAWAMTLNQAPAEQLSLQVSTPVMMHLRNCCDNADTFEELVESVQLAATATPFFAHCVGTVPQEQCVTTGLGRVYSERHSSHLLLQTNHYVEPDVLEEYNPPEEFEDTQGQTWVYDTYERYRVMGERLVERLPLENLDDALQVLQCRTLTKPETQQQMAFHPASGTLRVLARL